MVSVSSDETPLYVPRLQRPINANSVFKNCQEISLAAPEAPSSRHLKSGSPKKRKVLMPRLRSFDVTRSRVHGRPESHAVFCLNKVKTQNTSATTGSQGMLDLGVTRRWCSRCVGRLRMRGRVAPICGLVPRAQVRAERPRAVAGSVQRRGHHERRAHRG